MNPIQRIQEWNKLAGVKQELNLEKLELYLSLIDEEYNEVAQAVLLFTSTRTDTSYQELLKELADLIVVTTGAIHCLGQSATKVLEEVNDSNYSKFPIFKNYDAAKAEGESVKKKYGLNYLDVELTNTGRTVFKREDGKILKPSSYREADMSKFKLSK